jgi:predicted RNA binding protein YcfA (HicA-like mRNA interferase family)
MARLYLELARKLRRAGCEMKRQGKGSHEIWYSPFTNRTFSVPANLKSLKLANEILKQAGLPSAF